MCVKFTWTLLFTTSFFHFFCCDHSLVFLLRKPEYFPILALCFLSMKFQLSIGQCYLWFEISDQVMLRNKNLHNYQINVYVNQSVIWLTLIVAALLWLWHVFKADHVKCIIVGEKITLDVCEVISGRDACLAKSITCITYEKGSTDLYLTMKRAT